MTHEVRVDGATAERLALRKYERAFRVTITRAATVRLVDVAAVAARRTPVAAVQRDALQVGQTRGH